MSGGACPVTVVWDPRFEAYDFGPHHPFTQKSRGLAVSLLEASGYFDGGRPVTPQRVDRVDVAAVEALRRFHHPAYLEKVAQASKAPRGSVLLDRGDTPAFPGCYEAAARIAQGTLLGLREVLEHPGAHALNPAGGLHHAAPDRASGFCIFDDVALALATALEGPGRVRRVAYVDIDAHHGDGVMYGFYESGHVLHIDVHQDGRTLFPGTGAVHETGKGDGAGLKVNLPLPPGAGDEALVPLFDRIVPPLLREFRPELIVLQTGIDGHVGDPLAHLQYTPAGYEHVIGQLHALAHEVAGGRLLETGGGGYLGESVSRTLARGAYLLRGGHPVPPGGLPARWRREFEAKLGYPAPERWETLPPRETALWDQGDEEKLVHALEKGLGRKFPRGS